MNYIGLYDYFSLFHLHHLKHFFFLIINSKLILPMLINSYLFKHPGHLYFMLWYMYGEIYSITILGDWTLYIEIRI